ncbi:MAG: hypothetical protein B6D45_03920, partial [Ignavibacteriales bacterium UTCHB3]
MIVVFENNATEAKVERVINRIVEMGYSVQRSEGTGRMVISIGGIKPESDIKEISMLDGVAKVLGVSEPYLFA